MRSAPLLLLLSGMALAGPAAAQLAPSGPQFPINSTPLQVHAGPELAVSAAGEALAVWTVPFTAEYNEVWARAFDAAGNPLGSARRIDSSNVLKVLAAPIALRDGGFAAAWTNIAVAPSAAAQRTLVPANSVSVRLLSADGQSAGVEQRADMSALATGGVRIAPLPGGFVVAWSEHAGILGEDRLVARRFSSSGSPIGLELTLDSSTACSLDILTLGSLADGGFAAFWHSGAATQPGCPGALARRFDANGQPAVPIFPIPAADLFAIRSDGTYLAVRNRLPPPELPVASGYDVYVQLYGPDGVAIGGERSLTAPQPGDQRATAAVAGEERGFLVVWSNDSPADDDFVDADVSARLLDDSGSPVGGEIAVASQTAGDQLAPRAATDGLGSWAIGWASEPPRSDGGDLFARRFTSHAFACDAALCLGDGRFGLDVAWRDPRSGSTGVGHAIALTGDTGAYWFFSEGNVELFVKVLDGRVLNSHFWVFYGSLSDVEYTLTIVDHATGLHRTYHNPPYTLASHADIDAFPASGAAPTAAVPAQLGVGDENTCFSDAHSLCFNDGRFRATVGWTDPRSGLQGQGQAVRLSGDSGYFWFFTADNVELVVKVLDGRPVNGHFWVFYASLSDVEYTITVTDGASGAVKTYHNPPYTLASRADTQAF